MTRSGLSALTIGLLISAAVLAACGPASDEQRPGRTFRPLAGNPTSREATPRPTARPVTGAYYANCSAAKAAGAAPISRGQPGYRRALDGDNDGIACE